MLKDSPLLADLSRLLSGAGATLLDVRREIEAVVNQKVEALLARHGAVSREEFDRVAAMAAKAREENENLLKRIEKLEK